MATGHSILALADGARLAYEVIGSYHLGRNEPIVLVCGMTSLRSDWERLSQTLARTRPVLLYDHRGIGDSSFPDGNEDLTIELLARDLLQLLTYLGWKELSICGYSMGGVVAQQMLLFPHHPTNPAPLPFRTTHLILAATRSVVIDGGLRYTAPAPNKPRTLAERMEVTRRIMRATFDPSWLEHNTQRFELFLSPLWSRPAKHNRFIAKQGVALREFDFEGLLSKLSQNIQVMVIHGQLDQVIPPDCGVGILKRIPWAKSIEVGDQPGQVPTMAFGHQWYEYFDAQVWHDVVDVFMKNKGAHVAV
ncbi:Alpha/Beta hydrolase protein [Infundibulicybe gibba]|nr:Alpha/Beta hydrolase protein [Infundibulicybe gibba]